MSKDKIQSELKGYKQKFYINQLIKGIIISGSIILSLYILVTSVEYIGRMGSIARGVAFFGFLLLLLYLFYRFIFQPILFYFHLKSGLTDEEAAIRIGSHFPGISDRLLNYLQLKNSENGTGALVAASLQQRAILFSTVSFTNAIDLRQNKSYLKYIMPAIFSGLLIIIFLPQLFTTSTDRIVNYSNEFAPIAPFRFQLEPSALQAFKNEDHPIRLILSGAGIPESVYLLNRDRKIKMASTGQGVFEYTFPKIQNAKRIRFEAAGFLSNEYIIELVNRPNLKNFNVFLDYPAYLRKKNERIENIGNLVVPEGTIVAWQFDAIYTDAVEITIKEETNTIELSDNNFFEYEWQAKETVDYRLHLINSFSDNKDKIKYQLNVVPDEFPKLNLSTYQDTVLYSYMILGGNISDDYGITNLKLFYSIISENNKLKENSTISLSFNPRQNNQSYYYQWSVDSLKISKGDKIEYYVKVWDNDGFNGIKSSKSATYVFKFPSEEAIGEDIEKASDKTSSELEQTLDEAERLKKELKEAEEKLRGKKQLEWQDEKRLEELLRKKEELNKSLKELQKQFDAEKQKRDRFKNESDEIRKKVEDIEKLMDELLDEETRKLYEELQKLLDEEQNSDKIQNLLNQMDQKEENLIKELERTLELFKRMQFDYKLEEAIQDLNKLGDKQLELSEESKDKSISTDSLAQDQQEMQEAFEEFEKSMEELNELNQELKNPNPIQDQSEQQESIKQEMQKSQEMLDQKKRKKASESQMKSGQKMKKMLQDLQQMQSSMEMQQMQTNLNDLRDILYNLIKLSFDQEELMNEFRTVDQTDPKFVDLGQWQLDLKDDAKIVEDSLLSLAKRAGQMGSFVTREVSEMNSHMDNSIQAIRDRKKAKATSEQQFAMTSMNNLALMLDDVMEMMQKNLSEAMGNPNNQGNQPTPSLSELQKQLNQQIEQLKKSGKSGRELSEELAKLAAEQERIRKAMQQMESQLEGGEGENRNNIAEKMEETEIDLVNKQITAETIKRQKEILTRLLESENAMRERELDNEREGETANNYENELPKAFDEYFKAREKEIELLKTVPPKLYPYYKKEVNEYFKRIGNQNFE